MKNEIDALPQTTKIVEYIFWIHYLYSKPISQFHEKETIVRMASLRYEAKAIQESFCFLAVCLFRWSIMNNENCYLYFAHIFMADNLNVKRACSISFWNQLNCLNVYKIRAFEYVPIHFQETRNIRHSHLIWDAYAYMSIAIWLYVHLLVNRWLVASHVGKWMSIASTENVLYPKPNKNTKTTNGSVARDSVACRLKRILQF